VLPRLREGGDPLGLQSRGHVRGERLAHAVCGAPVVRQLGSGGTAGEAGVGAQGFGERQVQRGPLTRQQVGVGGLLQQGVAEGVAVAVVDEHVVRHGGPQRIEERGLGQVGDGGEQPMPGPPAGRRGHAQHRACILRQRLHAQAQDVAQGGRQRARRAVGGGQQLLDEERVALAARVQARDELRFGGAAEDPRHLRRELRRRERLELDALNQLAALLFGQERAQRMAAMELVAAIGAHDQQALVVQPTQQRRQELERGTVGPVQVLDGEQHGRLGGQPVEQRAQEPEQARLGVRLAAGGHALRALGPRQGWAQLGREPRQLVACPSEQLVEGCRIELAGEPAQRGGERRIGQLARAEGHAVAAQHARPAIDGPPLELAQQPRLADAGLAGHERGGRRAALGPPECRLEPRELRGTADELGAGDARWHVAIISTRRWRGEGAHARRRAFSRGVT
jgi:hypothetical protein